MEPLLENSRGGMSSLRHFQEIFLRNDRNILVLKCEKHSPEYIAEKL